MASPWEKYRAGKPSGRPWEKYSKGDAGGGGGDANAPLTWTGAVSSAMENAPASAMQFASDMIQPVIHPINTVNAILDLAAGGIRKGARAVLPEQAFNAVLGNNPDAVAREELAGRVGQHFSDRYGGVENIKRTLATDPVGMLGDASMVLTGGGGAAARAPGLLGKAGRIASKAGDIVNPLTPVTKGIGVAGTVASPVVGLMSGTGAGGALREAARAGKKGGAYGKAFRDEMRASVPQTDVIDEGLSALNKMASERGAKYNANMQGVRSSQRAVDLRPIVSEFRKLRASLHHNGLVVSPDANKALNEAGRAIVDWMNNPGGTTPAGMDALKRRIDDMMPPITEGNKQATRVLTSLRNTIKAEIVKQAPEYAKTMKDYETAANAEKEIRSTLSMSKRGSKDAALRKLQSTFRNNVNTNYGSRMNAVKELEKAGAGTIIPRLAGQQLSSLLPRGLNQLMASGLLGAGLYNPAFWAALPLTSPRLMGEIAHGYGRFAGPTGRGLLATGTLNRGME